MVGGETQGFVVVEMRHRSLFDEGLPSCSKGEAPRRDGRRYQAAAAWERSEPIMAGLMQEAVNRENVIRAWKRVRANKGSPGIDGMTVDELTEYLREHGPRIREELLTGEQKPPTGERRSDSEAGRRDRTAWYSHGDGSMYPAGNCAGARSPV